MAALQWVFLDISPQEVWQVVWVEGAVSDVTRRVRQLSDVHAAKLAKLARNLHANSKLRSQHSTATNV